MKKFKSILSILTTILLFTAMSCGGGGGNAPGDVIKSVMTNLDKGNIDKVIDDLYTGDKEMTDEENAKITGILQMSVTALEQKKGIKSMEIISEEIAEDGESAKVEMKIVYGDDSDDTQKYNCEKVDGKWKMKMK